ncbi:MAG: hypothetical protein EXS13_05990 [Planctomycetes bacterium]|nr:hypothetical protein [Planctomycetota bacterium]
MAPTADDAPQARLTFVAWLAHVRERLDAATRDDPWRGQPPHQPLFMLMVDRAFLVPSGMALVALLGAGVIALLGDSAPRWLPWWLPLAVALLSAARAAWIARAERADCRDQLERVQRAELAVAAVVMANNGLFDPRVKDDLPGVVVATLDPQLQADPDRLTALAARLFALKDRPVAEAPAALRPIAAILTSESGRFTPLQVPSEHCGNDATWLSSCWLFREQLRKRVIERRIYPVLAQRRADPQQVRALPMAQWWGAEFDAALAVEFGLRRGVTA